MPDDGRGFVPEHQDLGKQDAEEYLGSKGALRYMVSARGQKLAEYFWPALTSEVHAIIYLCHGHGSYVCYDFLKSTEPGRLTVYEGSWVQAMNSAGYSVVGLDYQGAGRSSGLRCYADSFEHYVEDMVAHIRSSTSPSTALPGFPAHVPKYVMGISMGGCLATVCALREPTLLSGALLLAPMLSLEKVSSKGINRLLRPVGAAISALLPKLPVAKKASSPLFPELRACYEADKNNWTGDTRARNAMEYLRVTTWLMRHMESVAFPFIAFHGLKDDMCDPDGSKALYLRAQSQDKTLVLLDDSWHVLTKEPENNIKVLQQSIAWLDKRCKQEGGSKEEVEGAGSVQVVATAAASSAAAAAAPAAEAAA